MLNPHKESVDLMKKRREREKIRKRRLKNFRGEWSETKIEGMGRENSCG